MRSKSYSSSDEETMQIVKKKNFKSVIGSKDETDHHHQYSKYAEHGIDKLQDKKKKKRKKYHSDDSDNDSKNKQKHKSHKRNIDEMLQDSIDIDEDITYSEIKRKRKHDQKYKKEENSTDEEYHKAKKMKKKKYSHDDSRESDRQSYIKTNHRKHTNKEKEQRHRHEERERDNSRNNDRNDRKDNFHHRRNDHNTSSKWDQTNVNEESREFGNEEQRENKNKVQKEEPNFQLSGKLTEYTNTYNGVVILYNEPTEARKPKTRWRLYPFKGDEALPMLQLHRQSAFLLGRDRKIADIPVDHPSCSKQHAVIQFRLVEYERPDGMMGRRVKPYVIDLDSTNGTYVNNKRIETRRYVELIEKDVVKFGFSSREYVILHEKSKDDEEFSEDTGEDKNEEDKNK